jgi:surface protein
MFNGCKYLTTLNGLEKWNLKNIKNCEGLFGYCEGLKDIKSIQNWNMKNINDCSFMFYKCNQLEDINPIKNWNLENIEKCSFMFSNCGKLDDLLNIISSWKLFEKNCDICGIIEGKNERKDIMKYIDNTKFMNEFINNNLIFGHITLNNTINMINKYYSSFY